MPLRRPKLTVAPTPNPADPAVVRRPELNTVVAAVAAGHLLAGALIQRGKALLVLPDDVLAGPASAPDRGPLPGDLLA